MRLTALFLYALTTALYAATAFRVHMNWSGQFPIWQAIIPPALLVSIITWFLSTKRRCRFFGANMCFWVMLTGSVLMFWALSNTAQEVKSWQLLALRNGLDYDTWKAFVLRKAFLWLTPSVCVLPIIWARNGTPRGRLTVFFGACTGIILTRIFIERIPTRWLIDYSLAGMLLSVALWGFVLCTKIWTRACALGLLVFFTLGWYFGSFHSTYELLKEVNPFAPIAARGCYYTGVGTQGVSLKAGRLLRTDKVDSASQTASQLIPVLLRPDASARIAIRTQANDPLLSTFEIGSLKGLYDAIWVELPPAWMPEERDFFKTAALEAVLSHLNETGLLVYVLDGQALDAKMLMTRIAILKTRFPFVQIWMTGLNQWQLVASRKAIRADFEAISALSDRPEVALALLKVNIEAPVTLLACCLIADTAHLEKQLIEPVQPKLQRSEAKYARRLLFDGQGSQRLIDALIHQTDDNMPWVDLPNELETSVRPVLQLLCYARTLALEGNYSKASEINPCDPFLLGLADREIVTAQDWEKMAEHRHALASYASAFAIAKPRIGDVLDAALIAQRSEKPDTARPYYRLAMELDPENLRALVQYAHYLYENNCPQDAVKIAKAILAQVNTPEETTVWEFFIAQCLTLQKGHEKEGLKQAYNIAVKAKTTDEKDRYIPAYAQLLINTGEIVRGVRIKRHYRVYNELLPEELNMKMETP